jgi:tetratricopeptide (TPR) repeat protein
MRYGLEKLLGVLLLLSLSQTAAAQTETEARAAFQAGVTAFESGRISEALVSFERAYALRPAYKILFNIAQAQAELGKTAQAIRSFEKYLEDGAEEINDGRRLKVEEELERLRLRAERQTPTTLPASQPEGTISVDNAVMPKPQHRFLFNVAPWISTGIAAATLTTGILLGAKAASINKRLGNSCVDDQCSPRYGDDIDSMKKMAVSADVLFVATSLFTAAAISLFVMKRRSEKRGEK